MRDSMEIELNAYLEENPGVKNGKYKRDLKTKYGEIKQFINERCIIR